MLIFDTNNWVSMAWFGATCIWYNVPDSIPTFMMLYIYLKKRLLCFRYKLKSFIFSPLRIEFVWPDDCWSYGNSVPDSSDTDICVLLTHCGCWPSGSKYLIFLVHISTWDQMALIWDKYYLNYKVKHEN